MEIHAAAERSWKNSPPLPMHKPRQLQWIRSAQCGPMQRRPAKPRPRVCVEKKTKKTNTKARWSSGLYIMHDVLGQSVGSWSGLSLSAVVVQNRQSSQWSGRRAALNGLSSSSCKPATTVLPRRLQRNQYQEGGKKASYQTKNTQAETLLCLPS